MSYHLYRFAGMLIAGIATSALSTSAFAAGDGAKTWVDPVTRYIHVSYTVPSTAPDEVKVTCKWSPAGKNDWHPADVMPLISDTGKPLVPNDARSEWTRGVVTEKRAAGLRRTVIFDPYPDAQKNGRVDAEFRIDISTPSGEPISTQTALLQADNSDVVYLTDFSKVFQKDEVKNTQTEGKWLLTPDSSGGNRLTCQDKIAVRPLTYPLDLTGHYAIFVSTQKDGGPIMLRLSGDERNERVSSSKFDREVFWRWAKMDREHLVIKQRHYFTGFTESSLDYVKLVPISDKIASDLSAQFIGKHDKFVTAYFEPYSWAFYGDIRENYQHREPISAYAETGVDAIDISCGRFGSKSVYEGRKTDQLIYNTHGDPINDKVPVTDNVGRMQQYTNTFTTEMKYAREMGADVNAQFGATACYVDTPLQGDISKVHPEWRREDSLLLSVPGVQDFMLGVYRELLTLGAPGITIDFCRYPDGTDSAADCNKFMRSLRKLADEFGKARGEHIRITVRFPSKGTRKWECFDYKTWAHEGLVDYLCPSNIQGVYQFIDVKPYLDAAKGTKCKVTPEIDAIEWGPIMPNQFLWWAKHLYDEGAHGVYIYQADGAINSREVRECLSLLTSTEAIGRWLKKDADQVPNRSKGIYITPAMTSGGYNFWERCRIWLEGVKPGKVETYIDGKLIGTFDGPPYMVGTDGYESDKIVPTGEHTLLIRAQDGDGWLEQKYTIKGG